MTVVGIEFVDADTASGSVTNGYQVFPSAGGAIDVWRMTADTGVSRRFSPKAGEARFSSVQFLNAGADGGMVGRGTLEEMSGNPIIYNGRQTSGGASRVWRYDPVSATVAARTAAVASCTINDTTVRDYADRLYVITNETGTYRVRSRTRSTESTTAALNTFLTFTGDENPENIDVDQDNLLWVAGRRDVVGVGYLPYVEYDPTGGTTWTIPQPTGFSYEYVDTIQAVGVGEAIGVAENLSSAGDSDFLTFFRFEVGSADAVDITDGVTVDGQAYRDWAGANFDNIEVQTGFKVAVVGERVAARTHDGRILLGTLVRSGRRWWVGVAGWGG
jgi:hypothetical protein